jgi:hypothetical protein
MQSGLLTATDPDGRFDLDVAPHEGVLLVRADPDGDGVFEEQTRRAFAAHGDLGDLVLERAGSIVGSVTLRGAAPPATTLVSVAGESWTAPVASDGTYALGPLPAGTHRLVASAPALVGEAVGVT